VSRPSGAEAGRGSSSVLPGAQNLDSFLPGLASSGSRAPHAVACAQYHYLSNHLGGVRVEYDTSRRQGVGALCAAALDLRGRACGVPGEGLARHAPRLATRTTRSRSAMRALGFVCTKQTTDGQPGLEGLLPRNTIRDLAPDSACASLPAKTGPTSIPNQPRLEGADWPAERFGKLRTLRHGLRADILPVLTETFGEGGARPPGVRHGHPHRHAVLLRGRRGCSYQGAAGQDFAEYLVRMGQAQDDRIEVGARKAMKVVVRQHTWRLMHGSRRRTRPSSIHGTRSGRVALPYTTATCCSSLRGRLDQGDPCFEWRVRAMPLSA